ncbi:hypothetical protein B0T26DRAFT_689621 [Lasiosphaeria miniovina]|uniref:Nucleoside phosphorylase domain-containing protein n=1 Tax=Lasiosphaeria miniovina TaxID=1954250 RepID=A0AA40BIC9_9PEZI|nr:uncharacterized protein B0T26DRAFT_689621 [Lasiosphaeria miniovina]KAK0734775.1 hypothetical protein B0T26DRAFT_689621 [Lasiosphaeria miniovina]
MAADPRPNGREDFEIAIICALSLEASAVNYLFDEFWDLGGDTFQKAPRDENHYTTGRIGKFNVVLVQLPGMGKANAATAATFLLSSYINVRLALVVGVCGGVPALGKDDDEMLLGDVVISNAVVQYDFGRHYSHRFLPKNSIEDRLNKANKDVCALLRYLNTDHGGDQIQEKTARFLRELQSAHTSRLAGRWAKQRAKYQFPGTAQDRLFKTDYRHRHYSEPGDEPCGCNDQFACRQAVTSFCEDIGCDEACLVAPRDRLEFRREQERKDSAEAQDPCVYIGAFASGDSVMKSADERDRVAKEQKVIAFEMEGAGVWDVMPCIIIKGICDYSDSHKSKKWQNFAAAAAAAATKALLEILVRRDRLFRVDTTPWNSLDRINSPPPNHIVSRVGTGFQGSVPSQTGSDSALVGTLSETQSQGHEQPDIPILRSPSQPGVLGDQLDTVPSPPQAIRRTPESSQQEPSTLEEALKRLRLNETKNSNLINELSNLSEKTEDLEARAETWSEKSKNLLAEIDILKSRCNSFSAANQVFAVELKALNSANRNLSSDNELLEKKVKDLSNQADKHSHTRSVVTRKLSEAEKEMEGQSQRIVEMRETMEEWKRKATDQQVTREILQENSTVMDGLLQEKDAIAADNHALRADNKILEARARGLETHIDTLMSDRVRALKRLHDFGTRINGFEHKVADWIRTHGDNADPTDFMFMHFEQFFETARINFMAAEHSLAKFREQESNIEYLVGQLDTADKVILSTVAKTDPQAGPNTLQSLDLGALAREMEGMRRQRKILEEGVSKLSKKWNLKETSVRNPDPVDSILELAEKFAANSEKNFEVAGKWNQAYNTIVSQLDEARGKLAQLDGASGSQSKQQQKKGPGKGPDVRGRKGT